MIIGRNHQTGSCMNQSHVKMPINHRPRLVALILGILTVALYLPVAQYPYINYDDYEYVTQNPAVSGGITPSNLVWSFTAFHAGNWHPLTWISHQLDCTLFGPQPGPAHFVNVVFHALNSALVFLLCIRLTRKAGVSLVVAALFAFHPLHVESVAWISERKDVLSTLFGLLTLFGYLQWRKDGQPRSYGLTLLFFLLALLSKPMMITLPVVFLILDFWPLGRFQLHSGPASCTAGSTGFLGLDWKSLLFEKWPFFGLSAASGLLTLLAQQASGALASLGRYPFMLRVENFLVAITVYVRRIFWPSDLCVLYPITHIQIWKVLSSLLLISLACGLAWRQRSSRPWMAAGILWFIITLLPVSGIVQVGQQSMADRYMYFPSIGLLLVLVLGADELRSACKIPGLAGAFMAVVLVAACANASRVQMGFWKSGETLFRRDLVFYPNNLIAMVDLGVALDNQKRFDEARVLYQRAEKLDPGNFFQVHANLAALDRTQGLHADALAEYLLAIREKPDEAPLHLAAGVEYTALDQPDAALQEFQKAEHLDPGLMDAHLGMAESYLALGRDAEAVPELHEACILAPENYEVLAYSARVLASSENGHVRNGAMALKLAALANDLAHHTRPEIFDVMGMACAELGDYTNALACETMAFKMADFWHFAGTNLFYKHQQAYLNHTPWHESFVKTATP